MRTSHLAGHILLAILNYSASANHVNTTSLPHVVPVTSVSSGSCDMTQAGRSTSCRSFNMTQQTVPSATGTAQDGRPILSTPGFANVEVHVGDMHGFGVIQLTSSPTVLTIGDPASGIASPRCTPNIQSVAESLLVGNQTSTAYTNNITSPATVPTPTGFFNNTNFNISRLSTFAAPALQSVSGEAESKFRASSYLSVFAAASSVCFVILS